jgi:YHS domain-containing protein
MRRRLPAAVWLPAAVLLLGPATCLKAQYSTGGLEAPSPLAMRGFSPVSLVNTRQWVQGRKLNQATFDGLTYRLADDRELQMFRGSPERYAPVLGGDCVVHFFNTGKRKAGVLRHGVVHENRLYFFSNGENKQAFVDNPGRYVDVDLALDGNCPVCLVELNRMVPGQAELDAVLGGFRYRFPGAQQREMFLAQPLKYAAAAHALAEDDRFQASTSAASPAELSGPNANNDAEAQPGAPTSPREAPLPAPVRVALSGYCPVSILDASRWVHGNQKHSADHDGRRYLFAGEQERQDFLALPTKYVPALGGDCVVSLKDSGKRVEGSLYQAVIHRGRHYLFAGPREKAAFKRDPDAYADVDLALAGNCVVSFVDTGDEVAGKPEFTAWRNGVRFQLRGQEELETFLRSPEKYASAAGQP